MSSYDKLRKQKQEAHRNTQASISKFGELSVECGRVADVARDVHIIVSDLDRQFEQATKLGKWDVSFLFLATALQCARQYIFSNEKFRLTDTQGDKLVKGTLKKITPKSLEDVLFGSVPYDVIQRGDAVKEIGHSTGIGGATHRYRTLGHDPVLGWVFGPMNILSSTMTKSDIVTTYVVRDNQVIGLYPTGTLGAFYDALYQIEKNPCLLPAAVAKQAIHFGADYFTKQGLPVPLIGTLDNELAKEMVMSFNIDMYSITRSVLLASLINHLVSCIHQLFYCGTESRELYMVKTRKIITYSNTIASTSNVLYVALSKDLKKLDVGGMLITIYQLISNAGFKKKIKQEFMEKEFYNIVMGEK